MPPLALPPSTVFPLTEAQLVSLFMQSFAFGVHAVVFAVCIHRWFSRFKMAGLNTKSWPWVVVATALFIIGAVDVSLNLSHNVVAFVFFKGFGGATFQFEIVSFWINIVRSVLYSLNVMISDAALIYRCWIVCAHWKPRRWVVIALPCLLWLGATICASADVFYVATLDIMSSIPHEKTLRPYLFATYLLSLLLNISVTGLIVYRMWSLNKKISSLTKQRRNGSERLKTVNRIFLESALLYTLSVVISAVLEMVSNDAFYSITSVNVELGGITFDLIIIRTWTAIAREDSRTFVESFIMEPPPALPLLDFRGSGSFTLPPPSRISFAAPSELGSYRTDVSKSRRF
ncbi:uncharacterized protein C8Q71DRAFT_775722 [Rhodofomes roseus]|uniref:G-protein coupled receptors family 1 profile domain-containing protein n=1 Tax=Rhodofomes roseus TaxID=34475 RepID=A0ABQ8K7Q0_9APHY|nr:uncharacterized protein C8Q71DRAFT_775722 [Rhodofomes roseus]KAH9832949.1 hypothetical protein C8Q71DRAFT_775722 [Rhodofomes roseus]